jgi:polar amino acid transport system substrate-binding protein
MKTNKRRIAWRLLAMFAVLAMVVAACGGDDGEGGGDGSDTTAAAGDGGGELAEMFPDGSVRIGIANEIPYGYEDDNGEATGEAPEVAKAILADLGITEVDATVVDFGALIPGLQAGEYDMIAAGMFITSERAQEIIFSDPDYCGATAFAVPEGNPDGLTDFQSVVDAGIDLGVLSGAVEEGYALDSGVPDGNVIRFGETAQAFEALSGGRIAAVALTDVTVATQVAGLEGFESSEPFIPVVNGEEQLGCGGFGFVEQEFRDIFNDKLKEFQDQNQILPIVEEFGFSEASVEKAAELTVEDLTG